MGYVSIWLHVQHPQVTAHRLIGFLADVSCPLSGGAPADVSRGWRLGHAIPPPIPLAFTLEAPVAYEANNFSRNHIRQTRCSIDCKDDIIPPSPSQPFHLPRRRSGGGLDLYLDEIFFHGDGGLSKLSPTCALSSSRQTNRATSAHGRMFPY